MHFTAIEAYLRKLILTWIVTKTEVLNNFKPCGKILKTYEYFFDVLY